MIREIHTIEDFTVLLFYHMAHVDGSLHPNERDTIIERLTALYPAMTSVEQRLTAAEFQYNEIGTAGIEKLLKESIEQLGDTGPALKKGIYSGLFDIINANGRVNVEETDTLKVFREWLLN